VRIGISALRLHRQIGGIYAIAADMKKLDEIRLGGLTKNLKTDKIYYSEEYANAI